MLPTIIVGANAVLRAQKIQKLVNPQIELIHLVSDTSIKIKDVQTLKTRLSTSARLPRLIWFEEADHLTPPAQNALLKLLEEPPANTQFYLSCSSIVSLLPTIRSRCQITRLDSLQSPNPQLFVELKDLLAKPLGARLQNLPKLDRSSALSYFTDLQTALKLKLTDPTLSPPQRTLLSSIAKLALQAADQLTHNVSVSLAYTSFLLHLPKSK